MQRHVLPSITQDLEVAVSLAQHVCCGTSVHQAHLSAQNAPSQQKLCTQRVCMHACICLLIVDLSMVM